LLARAHSSSSRNADPDHLRRGRSPDSTLTS
jgi:hypothetical protein